MRDSYDMLVVPLQRRSGVKVLGESRTQKDKIYNRFKQLLKKKGRFQKFIEVIDEYVKMKTMVKDETNHELKSKSGVPSEKRVRKYSLLKSSESTSCCHRQACHSQTPLLTPNPLIRGRCAKIKPNKNSFVLV